MHEFLYGSGMVMLYIIIMAGSAIAARLFITIPDELFRKLLHFILLGAYIPLVFLFETWWMASAFAVILIMLFYPAITLVEKIPAFDTFINQRKNGEIKNSMILALSMMALSTFICWGILGDRYLVLVCVYAWGVGDAFAALIGKKFGKHKLHLPFADPRKSVEGTLAMFVTSAISVGIVLFFRGGMSLGACILSALLAAAMSAYVELCTKNGYDTFTCPTAVMFVVLPLIHLFGG